MFNLQEQVKPQSSPGLLAVMSPSYFILQGESVGNLQGKPAEQWPKYISQQFEVGKAFSKVIGRLSLASLHVS